MKKLLLSLVLVFFISTSATRVYAYYEDIDTSYITVDSTHVLVSQNMETNNGKNLVPKGAILGIDDIEEIVFTYTVFVQEGIKIDYHINNILIDNELVSEDIVNLFEFEFEVEIFDQGSLQIDMFKEEQNGYFVEITLKLSMNSPNEEQYLHIANKQLNFEVIFESVE